MFGSLRMEMASGLTFGYFLQAVPAALLAGIVYAVLRLVYLKRKKRQIVWLPEIMRVLFVCYLCGLCSLVILPANFWLSFFDGLFLGWWDDMGPFFSLGEINLVPTVIKYLRGELILGPWIKEMLIGNLAMFLPFGFFLPFVVENLTKKCALAIAVIVPIVVESLQLTVGRSFDVDDLICNFLGISIGLLIAFGIKGAGKHVPKSRPSGS